MKREIISTEQAPKAIGTYSQAVKVGNTVYLSGQIPLDPETMQLKNSSIGEEIHQVFKNLKAVAQAAGGDMKDFVKVNVYLTDLSNFAEVNKAMAEYFHEPYPARAAVGVKELPRGANVEIEGVMVIA